MLTNEDVLKAQEAWGDAIVKIGSLMSDRDACEILTDKLLDSLYDFEQGKILFKPTRASVSPFRTNKEGAMSYFIGQNNNFPEDQGYALQPWTKVRFVNAGILLDENRAVAMGNYFFTDKNGQELKVEYTFAYIKKGAGLKINLQHSSIPFSRSNN